MRSAALLFDLDGTIVDSAIGIAAALTEVSVGRGGEIVPAAQVRKLVSLGVETLVRDALGAVACDSATDIAAFREVLTGLPATPDLLYPGVRNCLMDLAGSGHPMAVVTNKPEALSTALLKDIGLAHLFDCIVGGDTLQVSKPDPGPLLHALARLGSGSRMAVMIGDSPVDGHAAAAAAIPFVLHENGYAPEDCAHDMVSGRFSDYGALRDVLCGLLARLQSA